MNQIQRYCRLQINFAFQTKPGQTKKGIERKNTQIKDKREQCTIYLANAFALSLILCEQQKLGKVVTSNR